MKTIFFILAIALLSHSIASAQPIDPNAYLATYAGNVKCWGVTKVDAGYYPEVIVSTWIPGVITHKFYSNLTESYTVFATMNNSEPPYEAITLPIYGGTGSDYAVAEYTYIRFFWNANGTMGYRGAITNNARNRAITSAPIFTSKDLVVGYTNHPSNGSRVIIYQYTGQGNTGYEPANEIVAIPNVAVNNRCLAVGQFNSEDQRFDIVLGEGMNIKVYKNINPSTFSLTQTFSIGDVVKDIVVGDINDDGLDDIGTVDEHYGGDIGGYAKIFLNTGNCVFNTTPVWTAPTPPGGDSDYTYGGMQIGHFNNDDYPDMVLSKIENYQKYILLNTGSSPYFAADSSDFFWTSDEAMGSGYSVVLGESFFDCECTGAQSFATVNTNGGYGGYTLSAYKQTAGYNPAPSRPDFSRIVAYYGPGGHTYPQLLWNSNRECDLGGYNIYRMYQNPIGSYALIGSVSASTTSYVDTSLTWTDRFGAPYYYYIKAKDDAQQLSLNSDTLNCLGIPGIPTKQSGNEGNIANGFFLNIHPNPFNATTNIQFSLPEGSEVNLTIYNLMGQRVETLADGKMEAGHHTVVWDGANYSSGIYFYKLTAGDFSQTKRMTLLK